MSSTVPLEGSIIIVLTERGEERTLTVVPANAAAKSYADQEIEEESEKADTSDDDQTGGHTSDMDLDGDAHRNRRWQNTPAPPTDAEMTSPFATAEHHTPSRFTLSTPPGRHKSAYMTVNAKRAATAPTRTEHSESEASTPRAQRHRGGPGAKCATLGLRDGLVMGNKSSAA